MKQLVCSAIRTGNKIVVLLPEQGDVATYESNVYMPKVGKRKPKTHYPGKNARDPQYVAHAKKRRQEIRATISTHQEIFSEPELRMVQKVLAMPTHGNISRISKFNYK